MTEIVAPAPAVEVPAPAAPAAPAAAPAPAAPAPASEPAVPDSGDPGLNLALKFVASKGIDLNGPAMQAAKSGDFSFVKAELAAMGEKATGWQEHLALAESAFERSKAQAEAHNAKVAETVYGVMGGQEQWNQVQAWASANATPEEKAQINAAFAAGGLQAKAAATYLRDAFARAGAGTKEPKAVASPTAGGASGPAANGPLSAAEYAKAVVELRNSKGGRDVQGSQEYKALQARRVAGMKSGR